MTKLYKKKGCGEIVADDFRHCSHCHGLQSRKSLGRHVKICLQKPKQDMLVGKGAKRKKKKEICFIIVFHVPIKSVKASTG